MYRNARTGASQQLFQSNGFEWSSPAEAHHSHIKLEVRQLPIRRGEWTLMCEICWLLLYVVSCIRFYWLFQFHDEDCLIFFLPLYRRKICLVQDFRDPNSLHLIFGRQSGALISGKWHLTTSPSSLNNQCYLSTLNRALKDNTLLLFWMRWVWQLL